MRFQGIPNEIVRVQNPRISEPRTVRFDADGVFETHNKLLAGRLKKRYPIMENMQISEPVLTPAPDLRRCKKCDFSCDNQGDLLAHYRAEHPKTTKEN